MRTTIRTSKQVLSKKRMTVGIIFAIFACFVILTLLTQRPPDLKITDVDMKNIEDGIYIGTADDGLVKASVSVEVSKGKILNISILEHDHLLGKSAEKIIESIVMQQSLDVDTVASATYSSNTLRKAVENALRQGEKE